MVRKSDGRLMESVASVSTILPSSGLAKRLNGWRNLGSYQTLRLSEHYVDEAQSQGHLVVI